MPPNFAGTKNLEEKGGHVAGNTLKTDRLCSHLIK
jgi:hypothetical protein